MGVVEIPQIQVQEVIREVPMVHIQEQVTEVNIPMEMPAGGSVEMRAQYSYAAPPQRALQVMTTQGATMMTMQGGYAAEQVTYGAPVATQQVTYGAPMTMQAPQMMMEPVVGTMMAPGVQVVQTGQLFDMVDRNHDGQITRSEFQAATVGGLIQ